MTIEEPTEAPSSNTKCGLSKCQRYGYGNMCLHEPHKGRSGVMEWGNSDGFVGDIWSLGLVVLECCVGHYMLIRLREKPDWAALTRTICLGGEKNRRNRGAVDELLHQPFLNSTCEL
ncbi:hypothetical protein GQ457_07G011760 [Hibiscus cannabinus]